MKKDFKISYSTKMMFEACGLHVSKGSYEEKKVCDNFKISRKTKKKLEKTGISFNFLEKVK